MGEMDYMIVTPIMEWDLQRSDLGPVSDAYNNSDLLQSLNVEVRKCATVYRGRNLESRHG